MKPAELKVGNPGSLLDSWSRLKDHIALHGSKGCTIASAFEECHIDNSKLKKYFIRSLKMKLFDWTIQKKGVDIDSLSDEDRIDSASKSIVVIAPTNESLRAYGVQTGQEFSVQTLAVLEVLGIAREKGCSVSDISKKLKLAKVHHIIDRLAASGMVTKRVVRSIKGNQCHRFIILHLKRFAADYDPYATGCLFEYGREAKLRAASLISAKLREIGTSRARIADICKMIGLTVRDMGSIRQHVDVLSSGDEASSVGIRFYQSKDEDTGGRVCWFVELTDSHPEASAVSSGTKVQSDSTLTKDGEEEENEGEEGEEDDMQIPFGSWCSQNMPLYSQMHLMTQEHLVSGLSSNMLQKGIGLPRKKAYRVFTELINTFKYPTKKVQNKKSTMFLIQQSAEDAFELLPQELFVYAPGQQDQDLLQVDARAASAAAASAVAFGGEPKSSMEEEAAENHFDIIEMKTNATNAIKSFSMMSVSELKEFRQNIILGLIQQNGGCVTFADITLEIKAKQKSLTSTNICRKTLLRLLNDMTGNNLVNMFEVDDRTGVKKRIVCSCLLSRDSPEVIKIVAAITAPAGTGAGKGAGKAKVAKLTNQKGRKKGRSYASSSEDDEDDDGNDDNEDSDAAGSEEDVDNDNHEDYHGESGEREGPAVHDMDASHTSVKRRSRSKKNNLGSLSSFSSSSSAAAVDGTGAHGQGLYSTSNANANSHSSSKPNRKRKSLLPYLAEEVGCVVRMDSLEEQQENCDIIAAMGKRSAKKGRIGDRASALSPSLPSAEAAISSLLEVSHSSQLIAFSEDPTEEQQQLQQKSQSILSTAQPTPTKRARASRAKAAATATRAERVVDIDLAKDKKEVSAAVVVVSGSVNAVDESEQSLLEGAQADDNTTEHKLATATTESLFEWNISKDSVIVSGLLADMSSALQSVPRFLLKYRSSLAKTCRYVLREQALLSLPLHVSKHVLTRCQSLFSATKHRLFHLLSTLSVGEMIGAVLSEWFVSRDQLLLPEAIAFVFDHFKDSRRDSCSSSNSSTVTRFVSSDDGMSVVEDWAYTVALKVYCDASNRTKELGLQMLSKFPVRIIAKIHRELFANGFIEKNDLQSTADRSGGGVGEEEVEEEVASAKGFTATEHFWKSLQSHISPTMEHIIEKLTPMQVIDGNKKAVEEAEEEERASMNNGEQTEQSQQLLFAFFEQSFEEYASVDDLSGPVMLLLAHMLLLLPLVPPSAAKEAVGIAVDQDVEMNVLRVFAANDGSKAEQEESTVVAGVATEISIADDVSIFKKGLNRVKVSINLPILCSPNADIVGTGISATHQLAQQHLPPHRQRRQQHKAGDHDFVPLSYLTSNKRKRLAEATLFSSSDSNCDDEDNMLVIPDEGRVHVHKGNGRDMELVDNTDSEGKEVASFLQSCLRTAGIEGLSREALCDIYQKYETDATSRTGQDRSHVQDHSHSNNWKVQMNKAIETFVAEGKAFELTATTNRAKLFDLMRERNNRLFMRRQNNNRNCVVIDSKYATILSPLLTSEQLKQIRVDSVDKQDVNPNEITGTISSTTQNDHLQLANQLQQQQPKESVSSSSSSSSAPTRSHILSKKSTAGTVDEMACPWTTISGERNHKLFNALKAKTLSFLSAYPGASILMLQQLIEDGVICTKRSKINIEIDPFATSDSYSNANAASNASINLNKYFLAC